MPILNRKRRARTDPEPTQPATRRRESPEEEDDILSSEEEVSENDVPQENTQSQNQQQVVKKLVRLALASEYSRTPIRRSDIAQKVMPPGSGRQFNKILALANDQLHSTFGMELTPLPSREKTTVSQKRSAQRSGTQNTQASASNNRTYILTSILPPQYRTAAILPPSKAPSAAIEGSYAGFATFMVGMVMLSPGQTMSEMRFEKQLRRVNADEYWGGERTEVILKRLIKDGYIVKIRERDPQGGEEVVEYMIGPRGKVEVGERGVAGLVRRVYEGDERKEVERRLVRSLGDVVLEGGRRRDGDDESEEGEGGEQGGAGEGEVQSEEVVEEEVEERAVNRRGSGRGRRRRG